MPIVSYADTQLKLPYVLMTNNTDSVHCKHLATVYELSDPCVGWGDGTSFLSNSMSGDPNLEHFQTPKTTACFCGWTI